jgi:hypothetical protein
MNNLNLTQNSELKANMGEEVYKRLAKHLSSLGMGYHEKEELLEILRENFTPVEAEMALAIPPKDFKELHQQILKQRKLPLTPSLSPMGRGEG